MVLIAFSIAGFARDSASPGSLYVYTKETLPPVFAAVGAWALFFAYVVTAASVTAGFCYFAYPFLGAWSVHVPAWTLAAVCLGGSAWWRIGMCRFRRGRCCGSKWCRCC